MTTETENWENYYDDNMEHGNHESCPNCGYWFDDIDFDYQICSRCNWSKDDDELKPLNTIEK